MLIIYPNGVWVKIRVRNEVLDISTEKMSKTITKSDFIDVLEKGREINESAQEVLEVNDV